MPSEAVSLLPTDRLFAAPRPGLRWVRRKPLWPTWKRRAIGVVIAAFMLPAAFRGADPVSHWKLLLLAWVAWGTPVARLLIERSHISGKRHVLREVSVRPSERAGDLGSISVDGREVGTAWGSEVWVHRHSMFDPTHGGGANIRKRWVEHDVVVVVNGTMYSVDRGRDEKQALRLGAVLAQAICGDPAKLGTASVGIDRWQGESGFFVMVACMIPFAARAFGGAIPALDPRFIAIGLLALATRAASGLYELAVVMDEQLDTKEFKRVFHGAHPASPIPWLTLAFARKIRFRSYLLLFLAAATVAIGRR